MFYKMMLFYLKSECQTGLILFRKAINGGVFILFSIVKIYIYAAFKSERALE